MPVDIMDNEDSVFESRLADRRHKELVNALRGILTELQKDDGTGDIVSKSIDKQSEKIMKCLEELKNIPKQELPEINVETNQQQVVQSINGIGESIVQSLLTIKESMNLPQQKKEWTFKVKRNNAGYIESITANEK